MYKLVFEDHFEGEGLPNEKYWNISETGDGHGNNEAQHYTRRLDNVFVKDSMLHLVAKKEDFEHQKYTSGKITTARKVSVNYGKIEVRAKLPTGKGMWPAIWMLAENIRNLGWPLCGEIDIMENVGKVPEEIHFSLHSKLYNHKINTQQTYFETIKGITKGFHVYKLEWDEDYLKFFVDDKLYTTFKKGEDDRDTSQEGWPFIPPYFLILNFAVGGFWGGEIDDSVLPQTFYIDYVKIYEKVG